MTSPMGPLIAQLESVDALDGPARAVARTVRGVIPDGTPKHILSGAWFGHAVHPIMTDIPIGVWTSAVILDWTGGEDKSVRRGSAHPGRRARFGRDRRHRLVGLG